MWRVCGAFMLLCGLLAPSSAQSSSASPISSSNPGLVEQLTVVTDRYIIAYRVKLSDLIQFANGFLKDVTVLFWFYIDSFTPMGIKFEQTGTDGQVSLYIPFKAFVDAKNPRFEGNYTVNAAFGVMFQVVKDKNGHERVILGDCTLLSDSLQISSEESFALGTIIPQLDNIAKFNIGQYLKSTLCPSFYDFLQLTPVELLKQEIRKSSTIKSPPVPSSRSSFSF